MLGAAGGKRRVHAGDSSIAVLGSHSAFTAEAVRTLCVAGVRPAALMVGAGTASGTRGAIPIEVRDTASGVAAAYGIPLIQVPDPNHPDVVAALERIGPDLLLLACLPCIVSGATRDTARLGALNLHPSALPRFRGPNPVFWQMRAGVARAAVTLHVATGAVDAGPIVVQRWLEVAPGIGSGALTTALVRLGMRALVEILPAIERRIREAVPQDESASTRQGWPHPRDYCFDTSWSAERAYRFIEGTRGPATTFTILAEEGEIQVERAIGFEPRSRSRPVVGKSGDIVTIRFADGLLRAVPARAAQASIASSSSNPNVDMSRIRDG